MNHPHASLSNILNFMWCTWKSRNDTLFEGAKREPYPINIHAHALSNNNELLDIANFDFKEQNLSQVRTQANNRYFF